MNFSLYYHVSDASYFFAKYLTMRVYVLPFLVYSAVICHYNDGWQSE